MMCGKLCQNVWPFQVGLIRGFRVIRLVYDMMHYLLQQYMLSPRECEFYQLETEYYCRLNKITLNFLTSTLKLWSDVQGLWLVLQLIKILMKSSSRNTQNGQIQDTQGEPRDRICGIMFTTKEKQ